MAVNNSEMDPTNIRNVIWCCKRKRDIIPYPGKLSKAIETVYENKSNKVKQFELNEDNIIVFDRNGYYERNLTTNKCFTVFRVVVWAYCERNENLTFHEWKLFTLKHCIQIEDSYQNSKSLTQYTINGKGIVNFNSLNNTPSHFIYHPFGTNKCSVIRRGGVPHKHDKIVIVAIQKDQIDDIDLHPEEPNANNANNQSNNEKIPRRNAQVLTPSIVGIDENDSKQQARISYQSRIEIQRISRAVGDDFNIPNAEEHTEILTERIVDNPYKNEVKEQKISEINRRSRKAVKLPKNVNDKWKKGKKKYEQNKREKLREQKRKIVRYKYISDKRDSSISIESELDDKYNDLMNDTLDQHYDCIKDETNMKYEYLVKNKKLKENEHKLMESINNYNVYEQEMHQKSLEELYEKEKLLRSLNYKMKAIKHNTNNKDLEQLQLENKMIKKQLVQEKLNQDFIAKMNEIDRMLIMIDSDLLNDDQKINDINNDAKIKSSVQKMNKKINEDRIKNKKKSMYGKQWVDSVLNTVKNEEYEHPNIDIKAIMGKSPKLKLKDGFNGDRRRSSIFKPVKSNFW